MGFCPEGGIGAGGVGLTGITGDAGLDSGRIGTVGLAEGIDLASLIGKFGGILISGVRGLAVPSIVFSGGGGPLGFGGVIPLGAGGFVLIGDGEGGGVVDPETGGLISSIFMQATPICEWHANLRIVNPRHSCEFAYLCRIICVS